MQRFGMKEGEVLQSSTVTRVLEGAQRKVEGHNFDMRKQLIQYDDVANEQRHLIYQQRDVLLESGSVKEMVERMIAQVVDGLMEKFVPPESFEEQWDIAGLQQTLSNDFGISFDIKSWLDQDTGVDDKRMQARIHEMLTASYQEKREELGDEAVDSIEKVSLTAAHGFTLEEHLANLAILRQGIHLRGYAQKKS